MWESNLTTLKRFFEYESSLGLIKLHEMREFHGACTPEELKEYKRDAANWMNEHNPK